MSWRLRWLRKAVEELADVWLNASSDERDAITRASRELELRLNADPFREGESRDKGRRIAFAAPLAVTYHISSKTLTVSVLQIRVFRRRKK